MTGTKLIMTFPVTATSHLLADYRARGGYATLERVLREALRVLAPKGHIVVMDTPIYRRERDGAAMIAERHDDFEQRFGTRSDSIPSIGFVTMAQMRAVGGALDDRIADMRPIGNPLPVGEQAAGGLAAALDDVAAQGAGSKTVEVYRCPGEGMDERAQRHRRIDAAAGDHHVGALGERAGEIGRLVEVTTGVAGRVRIGDILGDDALTLVQPGQAALDLAEQRQVGEAHGSLPVLASERGSPALRWAETAACMVNGGLSQCGVNHDHRRLGA